ncbi:MAG TPA: hypothetical protein VH590_06790 [Ktedonobacterales bacterium]|jgi:hypothetical protein
MKNQRQRQTLTVGELCAAIADGRLPATLQDNQYQVNGRDLRRFVNGQRPAARDAAPRIRYSRKEESCAR